MTNYPPLHGPDRPSWACVSCGEKWPCDIRKAQLRELFAEAPDLIVGYLVTYGLTAQEDLGLADEEMAERFVRWVSEIPTSVPSASAAEIRERSNGKRQWPHLNTR